MATKTAPAKAAAKEPEILIDLDALDEPQGYMRAGKERYAFRKWEGMSFNEHREISRDWKRVLTIETKANTSNKEGDEYEALVHKVLVRICDLPDDVAKGLTTAQKVRAVGGYFGVQTGRATSIPVQVKLMAMGLPSTSQSSSSASTGSGRKGTKRG